MRKIKVYTFNPKNQINQFDIFVLSRGLNSGKPLDKPCANSFVVACKDQAEKDFYKTLIAGLWKINYFKPLLLGSVIPFLRITDFKQHLHEQAEKISFTPDDFRSDIDKIKIIEAKQRKIAEQVQLLEEAKRIIMYRNFKNRRELR